MASPHALAASMRALGAAFNREITPDTLEAFGIGLADLEDGELQRAAVAAIRGSRFFPTPADLRAYAGKGGARQLKADAASAWERVQEALGTLGEEGGADFGPIANAVVRNLGGWSALWHEPFKALPFTRRRFEELYESFAESRPSQERCAPHLPGPGGRYGMRLGPGDKPADQISAREPSDLVRQLAEGKALK